MCAAALSLANSYGLRVLPVHTVRDGVCSCAREQCSSPGKHPRTRRGAYAATRDHAQIRAWWTQWPDANIGIATGAYDDQVHLIGIDLDVKDGRDGVRSFQALAEQKGPLPDTL